MAIEKEIIINVKEKGVKETGEKVKNSLNENTKATTELSGQMDKMTGGAVSSFTKMYGSLKTIATGFKGIGGAIAASGLGLLVLIIGGIIAAFRSSEEGQNKFAKIMSVIGVVTGNVMDVLASFGELIIGIFSGDGEAMKKIKSFGKSIYDVVGLPVKNAITIITTAMSTMSKFIRGDFSGALDELKKGAGDIKQNFNAAGDAIKGVANGTKEFIEEQKREMKLGAEVADMRAKAAIIERNLLVEKAKMESTISELKLKSRDIENFTAKEREKALLDAQKIEDNLLTKEQKVLSLKFEAQKLENTFSRTNKENLTKEAQAEADLLNITTRRTDQQRSTLRELNRTRKEISSEQNRISKEAADASKKILDEKKKADEAKAAEEAKNEADRKNKLLEIQKSYIIQLENLEDTTELQRIARREKRALEELDALEATEDEKMQTKLFYSNLVSAENEKIKKEDAKKQEEIDKAILEQKKELKRQEEDLLYQGLSVAKDVFAKNKAVQKGIIIVENALALASLVKSTIKSVGKDNEASPLTFGMPWSGVHIAQGILGATQIISSTSKALAAVGGGSAGSAPSISGGGGSAPAPPQFNIVGQNSNNQLAQSIGRQQSLPIEAYVVSGAVTSAQAMDRNRVKTATFN